MNLSTGISIALLNGALWMPSNPFLKDEIRVSVKLSKHPEFLLAGDLKQLDFLLIIVPQYRCENCSH